MPKKEDCVLCNGDQPLIPGMDYKGEYLRHHLDHHHNTANKTLRVGDTVKKAKGYVFNGVVRAVFTNLAGEERLVVELVNNCCGNGNEMLHIFAPNQLEKTYE